MKQYIFKRILRSLLSIFLVTTLIYTIVYTMVPRKLIFKQDSNYSKMAAEPDKKTNYENVVFDRIGYIEYMSSKELQEAASTYDKSVTVAVNAKNKKIYEEFLAKKGKGWTLSQLPESKSFYATREIPVYERVVKFYSRLIEIDHPWRIQDEKNKDLERYIRIENDPAVGLSLVGSGTKHKYLVYFNGTFPFIHQNIVKINLGTSYPTYNGIPVVQVISQGQGKTQPEEVTFPTGVTKRSSIDIYSRTYKSPSLADAQDIANFGKGDAYTATRTRYKDPSMIANSAIIGLVSIVIQYTLAIPLGLLMARYKNTWIDSMSTAGLTFTMAMPTIALLYIVRLIGTKIFGLPDTFPVLGADSPLSYILPAVCLALLGIPGLAIWIRRYLIDQQSSDYVRFARAKGLSEKEISHHHIFKHAMVPLITGVPAQIVAVIAGATLTETVFAFPGMGKMLLDSIKATNNDMVVGLVFIFASLSIFAMLLGDILMTMLDPRIKLTNKGGK